MAKNKLKQFAEISTFSNVFEPSLEESRNGYSMKGNWNRNFFKNSNPVILEVGCGKGEFTTGLAKKYPERNFIGMDLKGNRIWTGSKYALENQQTNAAFLRGRVETIRSYFAEEEVSEIWIPFPDPQPRKRGERKRLTCPRFLAFYKTLLKKDGVIHLKTDNLPLYLYTLDVIREYGHSVLTATDDLYGSVIQCDAAEVKTYYESIFLKQGMKICYLSFQLKRDENKK